MTFLIHEYMKTLRTMFPICLKNLVKYIWSYQKIEIIANIMFHFFCIFCLYKPVINVRINCNVKVICNYLCQIYNMFMSYIYMIKKFQTYLEHCTHCPHMFIYSKSHLWLMSTSWIKSLAIKLISRNIDSEPNRIFPFFELIAKCRYTYCKTSISYELSNVKSLTC